MTSDTTKNLLRDLARSKKFREEFVLAHAKQSIPLQINDLLEQQHLTQTKLAALSGLPQGTISRAADPEYGNLTINTCVRIAAGFDVAFVGHFVPFSRLIDWLDEGGEDLHVAPFTDEFNESGKPHFDKEAVAIQIAAKVVPFPSQSAKAQMSLSFSPAPIVGRIERKQPINEPNPDDQSSQLTELYG